MGVELTVVLRTVITGASTKSENTLLFGVNHCTDITLLVQRLLKRCSVVKLLNISVRELAFKISCGGEKRQREDEKGDAKQSGDPLISACEWGVGGLVHRRLGP